MSSPLKPAFDYYLSHQDELVAKYRGRWIAIKGNTVLGDYPDQATAVRETEKSHELGTFLVQRVEPGTDAFSQAFHSRVGIRSQPA